MNEQGRDLSALFEAAIGIESDRERGEFLEQACGSNSELRAELERLLEANSKSAGFLSSPPEGLSETCVMPNDQNSDFEAGPRHGSVLHLISQSMEGGVPRVTLGVSSDKEPEPVVRPGSTEVPQVDRSSRYRLDGEIARGGMGAILKGRDTDLGRDLAVKVLLDEHRDKPAVIQRFVEEAQIGGQLQHPGIAPVYELGQFRDKRPFFTMKLIKGKTLSALLKERRSPDQDRAKFLGIFEQVCQTMAYAHSRNVIHRDLKPSNVMVGAFGEVQVMDWGLAKVLSEGGIADEKRAFDDRTRTSIIQTIRTLGSDTPHHADLETAGSQTQMGSVMGTPAYMPPEQALGEVDRLDQRSDVFGLGAILCEILTGDPPYTGETHTDVYRKASRAKLDECFDRIEEHTIDKELAQIVRDALQPEPEDRIEDATVLSGRIGKYLESLETRMRESELARAEANARAIEEQKRRRVILALAASVLLTCGVAGGGWVWIKQKDAELAKVAAAQQVEKLTQQQELAQQIKGELSSARALAKLDEDSLADPDSVQRAVEAIARAENMIGQAEHLPDLESQVEQARIALLKLQTDFQLLADLGSALEIEFEQSQYHESLGVPNVDAVSPHESGQEDESEILDAIDAYRRAFKDWGLTQETLVDDATEQVKNLHPSMRSTVIASLHRWLTLLGKGRPIDYWQQRPWVVLEPTKAETKGWGELVLLPEGVIHAEGQNWNAPYDLVFETDVKRISALRLEGLLGPGIASGPGSGPTGRFTELDLRVSISPRAANSTADEITFRSVTRGSGRIDPMPDGSWVIREEGGVPTAAVFELDAVRHSETGFVIHIHHAERFDCERMIRFRWLANGDDRQDESGWLAELLEEVDSDPWRRELRERFREEDVGRLAKMAEASDTLAAQPSLVVRGLAETLLDVSDIQLQELMPKTIKWHVASPEQFDLPPGVVAENDGDNRFKIRGAYPERETLAFRLPNLPEDVSAIRLELFPSISPGYNIPMLGRMAGLHRGIKLMEVSTAFQDQAETVPVEIVQVIQAGQPGRSGNRDLIDDDLTTGEHFWDSRRPVVLTLLTSRPDTSIVERPLKIQLATAESKAIGMFRISWTTDSIEIPNPHAKGMTLLEELVENNPSDFWSLVTLSDQLRRIPHRRFDAFRYATAAIALRPADPISIASGIRSFPFDQIGQDNQHLRKLRRLLSWLRKLRPSHVAIDEAAAKLIDQADLVRDEDPDRAIFLYKFAIDLSSPSASRYRALAQSLARLNPELAVQSASKAIEVEPANYRNYYAMSLVYDVVRNYDEALRWMQKAVEIEPDSPQARFDLGGSFFNLHKFEEAAEHVLRAAEMEPGDYTRHYHAGLAYERAEQFDKAIEQYQLALELNPLYASAAIDLQRIYWKRGEFEKALDVHRRRAELEAADFSGNPFIQRKLAGARNSMALMLCDLGRVDEGVTELEKAIQLDQDPVYLVNLANIQDLNGEFRAAAKTYEDAMQMFPGETYVWLNAASFFEGRGDDKQAAICYRRVTELETALPETEGNNRGIDSAYLMLARTLLRLGKREDALQVLQEGIDEYPNHAGWYFYVGEFFHDQGRFDEAIQTFQRIAETHSRNDGLMVQIARALVTFSRADSENDAKWAKEILNDVLDESPNRLDATMLFGIAEYRLGEWTSAAEKTQKVFEQKSGPGCQDCRNRALARSVQAMIAFRQNETEQAEQYLQEAEFLLGSRAFANNFEPQEWHIFNSLTRTTYHLLYEARQLVFGEANRSTENLRVALESARDIVQQQPPEEDTSNGSQISSWDRWMDLSLAYYERTGWQGAETEARLAIELADDKPGRLLPTAPLLLLAGKKDEYRKLCDQLLEDFPVPDPTDQAYESEALQQLQLLRLCSLDPDAIGQPEVLHQRAAALPDSCRRESWHLRGIARTHLRTGKPEMAIKILKRCQNLDGGNRTALIQNLLMGAIASHAIGDDDSLAWREHLPRHLERYDPTYVHYHDRMEIAVLRAELESLIGGPLLSK